MVNAVPFAKSALKPSAEILVVGYGNSVLEKRCLEAVRKYTDLTRHQLTYVDNWERDKVLGALWNELIAKSRHPYVVLLNSDTEVREGWLEPLVETALATGADAVGPMTDKCGTAFQVGRKSEDEPREVATLSGFCLLLKRLAWEAHGGFREDFPFYGQESNLLERLPRKFLCRNSFVHHEGGGSVKRSPYRSFADEKRYGAETFRHNRDFDWSLRLLVLGSGENNSQFPLWKGVNQAFREFRRERMECFHAKMDDPDDLEKAREFRPDVTIVANTSRQRVLGVKPTLRQLPGVKALWHNDLRPADHVRDYAGMFDALFICWTDFPGFPEYETRAWEEVTKTPVHYMPQGCPIVTELEPYRYGVKLLFIGATDKSVYHEGRTELVEALDARVLNYPSRRDRAKVEAATPQLYRQAQFVLSTSPKASYYTSIRLDNILAYGGLALLEDFPGRGRLVEHAKHVLAFGRAQEAGELMAKYHGKPAEGIRKAGWRLSQARHTVASRLMNMVSILGGKKEFWGFLTLGMCAISA